MFEKLRCKRGYHKMDRRRTYYNGADYVSHCVRCNVIFDIYAHERWKQEYDEKIRKDGHL